MAELEILLFSLSGTESIIGETKGVKDPDGFTLVGLSG